MTVNQDPKGQSVVVVDAINALLAGEEPEGMSDDFRIATAAVAITPDNVDEVLEGFQQ